MIGIDLDTGETYSLLKTYFRAKSMFPNKVIKVLYSPSGRGFHLRINSTEKNVLTHLYKRAMLGDDPYRILFSLKRYGMGGKNAYNIMFRYKNSGMEKPLDIDGILRGYGAEVGEIMEGIKNKEPEVDEEVRKLAEQIDESESIRPIRTWITCFALSREQGEVAKKTCGDIAEKDSSFRWRLHKSFYPNHDCVLVIYSPDKDTAHKRGTWFNKKVPSFKGVLYWVKEIKGKGD